ncbi:50S ribosomal protein L22 [Candidatus Saccharibacteria bacterium]|nr:50S ribosomal protein L22 [Candidatus Saccharibacteria bacterium]
MSNTITAKAIARGVQQTPRKVGLVASLVRGRTVADALVILEHTPKRAAKPVAKVIASAAANATNTFGAKEDTLVIDNLQVTSGPRLKRFRPIARGSANPYIKRTAHISVVVRGDEKPKKKPAAKKADEKETK